jgi:tetrahydromethanopterin S-methyltransferase subunit A
MTSRSDARWPPVAGDFVLGEAASPVAVCTLGSRGLLQHLAGRKEIAIAGRVYTENVGIERMVQNLVGNPRLRILLLCGRESPHRSGQTVLALHRNGLDDRHRVVGSNADEPFMPNLSVEDLTTFQQRIHVVDMIGELSPDRILQQARVETERLDEPTAEDQIEAQAPSHRATDRDRVEHLEAGPADASAWRYDPVGFFLVFVEREARGLRLEHYSPERRLLRVIAGANARDLCAALLARGIVTDPTHAAYLGRELARAEDALRLDLRYDQDSPLSPDRPA